MTSIYLVRCDDGWLYVDGESSGFRPSLTGAMVYGDRRTAAQTAAMLQAVPVEFREVAGDTAAGAPTHLHVVFDGPPGPDGGKFVEVENDAGQSVHAGEWVRRDDGLWSLRLRVFCAGDTAAGALAAAEATIARLRDELEQLRNRPSTHELAKRFLESTDG